MSRKRKTSGGNPAKRPVAAPATPHTPQSVLSGLTLSTAERVLEGLRLLEKLHNDFPELELAAETRVAFEVASLALIEVNDAQHGRTPYRIAMQKGEE